MNDISGFQELRLLPSRHHRIHFYRSNGVNSKQLP